MSRLKNGIITILAEGKKIIDLKITNAFPMIILEPEAWLIMSGKKQKIDGFQHFSIPPDLQIHLTKDQGGKKEYKFFETTPIFQDKKCERLFTYISPPISRQNKLQGQWEGGSVIISPNPDSYYDPQTTRLFIDFFIHINPEEQIAEKPLIKKEMRLAYDNDGCTLGPFYYDNLQRKPIFSPNILSSIRFGYINMEINNSCYLECPFKLS